MCQITDRINLFNTLKGPLKQAFYPHLKDKETDSKRLGNLPDVIEP